jgi:hypothetical protein
VSSSELSWTLGLRTTWLTYFPYSRRKGVTDQAQEKLTPDSQKSGLDQAKEKVTGAYDTAAGAVQPGTVC